MIHIVRGWFPLKLQAFKIYLSNFWEFHGDNRQDPSTAYYWVWNRVLTARIQILNVFFCNFRAEIGEFSFKRVKKRITHLALSRTTAKLLETITEICICLLNFKGFLGQSSKTIIKVINNTIFVWRKSSWKKILGQGLWKSQGWDFRQRSKNVYSLHC